MTVTVPNIPIQIYEDEKGIRAAVMKLRAVYPAQKCDDLKIPFDNEGNLLRNGHCDYQRYDYATRQYVSTGKFKVERRNEIFVDAIKFVRIADYGVRKGKVLFHHPDVRETFMSSKHFQEIAGKMVRGWTIAKFKYVKFYGAYGLECVEVLV